MSLLTAQTSQPEDLRQRYLDRAIRAINELTAEIQHAQAGCSPDQLFAAYNPDSRPVLGTGYPLASIFMIKYAPTHAEAHEGLAFYGRAGEAVLRSIERLQLDPTDMYGTSCQKWLGQDTIDTCHQVWLRRELEIVGPAIVVIMGSQALDAMNGLQIEDTTQLTDTPGIQQWSPSMEAMVCPDIDRSLDLPQTKREFWSAFKHLGEWYRTQPPW